MNDFGSQLSAALREQAQEISMSVDMQQAERNLQDSMRSARRTRRAWTVVGVAASIAAITAGAVFVSNNRTTSQPGPITSTHIKPSEVPYPFSSVLRFPELTATLPGWAPYAKAQSNTWPWGAVFGQTLCETDSGLCPDKPSRYIYITDVAHMYTLTGTKNVVPTYAELVTAWEATSQAGFGEVRDVGTTTVAGRRTTTMTVVVTRQFSGPAGCETATTPNYSGGCYGIVPGLTLNLAIVDQGAKPPTLLWESYETSQSQESAPVAAEFRTWLATVQFGK
jgi:hypothetical protein